MVGQPAVRLLLQTQKVRNDPPAIGAGGFSYFIKVRMITYLRYMETDKDHIHYMIETEPTMSISKITNLIKSYTTYHIWERYPNYLRKHFWKEHTFSQGILRNGRTDILPAV